MLADSDPGDQLLPPRLPCELEERSTEPDLELSSMLLWLAFVLQVSAEAVTEDVTEDRGQCS